MTVCVREIQRERKKRKKKIRQSKRQKRKKERDEAEKEGKRKKERDEAEKEGKTQIANLPSCRAARERKQINFPLAQEHNQQQAHVNSYLERGKNPEKIRKQREYKEDIKTEIIFL